MAILPIIRHPGPDPESSPDSSAYLKMPYSQWSAALAWCHGCAQLIRAGTDSAARVLHQLPSPELSAAEQKRQARMSPAGRNTSVAPQ